MLRARLGDHAAYGELIARHQARIRGWLRHLCGDHAEADDLAQEAFVRAWTRLTSLKDADRFSGWLMKIAYNQFLQSRRAAQKRNRLAERLAAEHVPPDEGASGPENTIVLQQALALLSARERAVVVLNYAYGYSHGEVSELTGLALGTVKSLIHRANNKIREKHDA